MSQTPSSPKSVQHAPPAEVRNAETPETELAALPSRRGRSRLLLCLAGLAILGGGFIWADWYVAYPENEKLTFVGKDRCIECHRPQADAWHGSHHDLAMDKATDETVLGDFNDATIEHFGVTSRMFRRDGKFFVRTEGPEGKMDDFQVKYVFGVEPLQQYLVEFDRAEGQPEHEIARLQTLPISWDTEKQRWFYLTPPDVDEKLLPDDPLYWTNRMANWNIMCADCHSTNLEKNFNDKTAQYHTTYTDIDVSCEACHGPGSLHVKLAESNSLFWDRVHDKGLPDLKNPKNHLPEIQSCAPCHTLRRHVVHERYRPGNDLYDYLGHELIVPPHYWPDGQIRGEVYVYGSYMQSKMFEEGIRCTDCHNAHTTKVKFTDNRLCTTCHQQKHPAAVYDVPAHHHHKVGSTGASCIECHMPATVYMEVDPRRDHSIRVPRPDLSVDLGTPNACTACHIKDSPLAKSRGDELPHYGKWLEARADGDKEVADELARLDKWAADATKKWYPESKYRDPPAPRGQEPARDHAYILADAWAGNQSDELETELVRLTRPSSGEMDIIRASAVLQLQGFPGAAAREARVAALTDDSPVVRHAALSSFEQMLRAAFPPGGSENIPPDVITGVLPALAGALQDDSRLVRTRAAWMLAFVYADVLDDLLDEEEERAFDEATDELLASLRLHNDQASAHRTVGDILIRLSTDAGGTLGGGRLDDAAEAFRTAIRVQPSVTGPRSNLAQLLEKLDAGRKQKRYTDEVRRLRLEESDLMARDVRLFPNDPTTRQRYGLNLYLIGKLDEAEKQLAVAADLDPQNQEVLLQLCLLLKKRQKYNEALQVVQRLIQLAPSNRVYQQIAREIVQERK